jgi:AbrB family looped-hinge helix DNA binding protein
MKKKSTESKACCEPGGGPRGCCRIEHLVTVDERGQMVLPKEVREKAGIRPGEKLAVISWEKDGQVCCLTLVRAGEFSEMLRGLLGPMVKDLVVS